MKNRVTIAIILSLLIVSSIVVVGITQNWFSGEQPETPETPEEAETPEEPETPETPEEPEQPEDSPINLILEVYGNADMDDIIDNKDVECVQAIIDGNADATQFADANNDGTIDSNDIEQINALLAGDASFVTLLDGNGKILTVSLPVNRIFVEYLCNAELVRVLDLENKVIGIDYAVDMLKSFYFPERGNDLICIGNMYTPDYEAVLAADPDVLLTFSKATEEKAEKLPGVDVVFLGLYYPNVTAPEDSSFVQGILKAGYIFNRVTESRDYVEWLLDLTDMLSSQTTNLDENEKPVVFMSNYPYTESTAVKAYATVDTLGQVCILAGGANIGRNLPGYFNSSSITVDAEWIMESNPEYIVLHTVRYTYGGSMRDDPAQGYDVDDPTSLQTCVAEYMAKPEFANIDAVKNGNVYIIAGDFRNNAMGGTLGAVYLAKILHPDLFTELDPEAVHQEYITRFLGLDYSLDEHGAFLYPALNINNDLVGIPNNSGE